MKRKLIDLKPQRSMQDSFMPRPDYCDRGQGPIFNGIVRVDAVICRFYCNEDCPAYNEYILEGKRLKRLRRRNQEEQKPERIIKLLKRKEI